MKTKSMKKTSAIGITYGLAIALLLGVAVLHIVHQVKGQHYAPVSGSASSITDGIDSAEDIFDMIFGSVPASDSPGAWRATPGEIILRLLVAAVLSSILVFRPRKVVMGFVRSLHVAETQILLSLVSAGLMLIVGDNAARAFAIFAAVSLVRFRTNIRDPKEITVLLISMALGLAAGVGRWDLGVLLCVFSLVILWFLERAEPDLVLRPMELKIKTEDAERTKEIVEDVLLKEDVEWELLRIKEAEDSTSQVVFLTRLRISITTDELSERIMRRAGDLIESIHWKSVKKTKSIYE